MMGARAFLIRIRASHATEWPDTAGRGHFTPAVWPEFHSMGRWETFDTLEEDGTVSTVAFSDGRRTSTSERV